MVASAQRCGLAELVDDLIPVVSFPDGRSLRGDQADIHVALSEHVGRPVTLAQEAGISHFDEGPLHPGTLRLGDTVQAR